MHVYVEDLPSQRVTSSEARTVKLAEEKYGAVFYFPSAAICESGQGLVLGRPTSFPPLILKHPFLHISEAEIGIFPGLREDESLSVLIKMQSLR